MKNLRRNIEPLTLHLGKCGEDSAYITFFHGHQTVIQSGSQYQKDDIGCLLRIFADRTVFCHSLPEDICKNGSEMGDDGFGKFQMDKGPLLIIGGSIKGFLAAQLFGSFQTGMIDDLHFTEGIYV